MWKHLRKWLRIAVTAVSLLVFLVLLVLSERSMKQLEGVAVHPRDTRMFAVVSNSGFVEFVFRETPRLNRTFSIESLPHEYRRSKFDPYSSLNVTPQIPRKHWYSSHSHDIIFLVRTPHWSLGIIFATVALLPWIKWRFSLRTLLIVMTLFAVFFEMIAISMRG